MTSAGPPPQYISFCEKKVRRPEGTYTLFWIQDTANHDTLAIVVCAHYLTLTLFPTLACLFGTGTLRDMEMGMILPTRIPVSHKPAVARRAKGLSTGPLPSAKHSQPTAQPPSGCKAFLLPLYMHVSHTCLVEQWGTCPATFCMS